MELKTLANIYIKMDKGESEEDALARLYDILDDALDRTGVSYQIHKIVYD